MAAMTQEEFDKRLAAAGGGSLTHSGTVGKRKVPNPSYNKYEPTSQETVELDIEQWVSPSGHKIQAIHMPDGSWDVIQDEPPAPKPGSTTTSSGTPSVPAGSVPRIEGSPIPGKPGEFDNNQPIRAWHTPSGAVIYEPLTPAEKLQWEREKNGGKTDAEVAAGRGKPRQSRVNPADPTKIQEFDPDANGGQGAWVDAGPNAAHTEKEQKEADSTVVSTDYEGLGQNRKKITTYKSGRKVTEAAPTNAQARSVRYETRNGKQVKITTLDDNTETTEEEAPKGRRRPPGAPRFRPDATQDDMGLTAYDEQLSAAVQAGIIDENTAAEMMEEAGKRADIADRRRNNQQSQGLTERSQNLGETQSRRNSANTQFSTADRTVSDIASRLIPGDGATGMTVVDAYRGMLGMMRDNEEEATGQPLPPGVVPSGQIPDDGRGATQIVMHPGGAMSISPQGSPAPGAASPAPAAAAPAPAAARPAAPAAAPASQLVPTNVITAEDEYGNILFISRAKWDADPTLAQRMKVHREESYDDWKRANPGAAIDPVSGKPPTAPAAAPQPGDNRPPTGSVLPPPTQPPGPVSPPFQGDGSTGPQPQPGNSGAPVQRTPTLFNPDDQIQALVDMGLDETEARNAIALYKRGVRADHL